MLGDIQAADSIGYVIRTLSPKEISANMLQSKPFNLNEMSHKAAMDMIRELLRMKVKVTEVYIDTVGDPEKYESKLQAAFSFTTIKFKVSKKADALYKCVSAASIVAKVALLFPSHIQTRRDHIIENHTWEEAYMEGKDFGGAGSGYPSGISCCDPFTSRPEYESVPCELYASCVWIPHVHSL